jgi:hypothetical protein
MYKSLVQGSIYWKIPPGAGKYQPISFEGKNMRRGREKDRKCKRKLKKGERKGRKVKENEERGSKRVK